MQDTGRVPDVCACSPLGGVWRFWSELRQRSDLAPPDERTKPLIPEMCFTSTGYSDGHQPVHPLTWRRMAPASWCPTRSAVSVHASECLTSSLHPVPGQGHLTSPPPLSLPTASHLPLPCPPVQRLLMCCWSGQVGSVSYCPPWAVPWLQIRGGD